MGKGKGEARKTVTDYCLEHSTPKHPVQVKLMEETIKNEKSYNMLGAPEVLMLNQQGRDSIAILRMILRIILRMIPKSWQKVI